MSTSYEETPDEAETPETAADYRALAPMAAVSVVLGVLSIATAFSWYLAIIPLAGMYVGWRALRTIREAPTEWTGRLVAQIGIGLSLTLWIVGGTRLYVAQLEQVPPGYQVIDFDGLQPDPNVPTEPVPQKALDLQDKRIFLRGYIQPRRQSTGIKDFILIPSSGECKFCTPSPKPTELIQVEMQGDLQTSYTNRRVGVAGRFDVDATRPFPYTIKADHPVQ